MLDSGLRQNVFNINMYKTFPFPIIYFIGFILEIVMDPLVIKLILFSEHPLPIWLLSFMVFMCVV